MNSKCKILQEDNDELQKTNRKLQREYEKLETEFRALQQQHNELLEKHSLVEGNLEMAQEDIKRLDKTLGSVRTHSQDLQREVENVQATNQELHKEVSSLKSAVDEGRAQMNSITLRQWANELQKSLVAKLFGEEIIKPPFCFYTLAVIDKALNKPDWFDWTQADSDGKLRDE